MEFRKGAFVKILVLVSTLSNIYCVSDCVRNPFGEYLTDFVSDPRRTKHTGFLEPTCIPSAFTENYSTGNCDRPCRPGDIRTCHYVLNIVSAIANDPIACSRKSKNDKYRRCIRTDGVETPVLTMNYMLPGPTIAVCQGDTIVVDVVNHLKNYKLTLSSKAVERNMRDDMNVFKVKDGLRQASRLAKNIWHKHFDPSDAIKKHENDSNYVGIMGESEKLIYVPDDSEPGDATVIHFHGALHEETPESDGVPFITQDPIPYGSYYRYSFVVCQCGTLWFHSHYKLQRSEGLYAYLLVRCIHDPHKELYDYDETDKHVIVADMGHNFSHVADNLWMKSRGCFKKPNHPIGGYLTVYRVIRFKRYLFRFVANLITSIRVICWIENHPFLLTAVDGNSIKPVHNVSSIEMANGERVDVVFKTDHPIDNYVIHCVSARNTSLHQAAILHYKGAAKPPNCRQVDLTTPIPDGLQYNTENALPGTSGSIIISELKGLEKIHKFCKEKHIFQYHLELMISNLGLQINHITDEWNDNAMLKEMYYYGGFNESNMCNAQSDIIQQRNCSENTCSCLHVVNLPLCECVEIILIGPHPFHLHGYRFYVVASGKDPNNRKVTMDVFRELDRAGLVKRNLVNPPMKDVVATASNGYTVIRFYTNNPGLWIAHCHIELHGATGMSVIFRIGSAKDINRKGFKYHYFEPRRNNVCK